MCSLEIYSTPSESGFHRESTIVPHVSTTTHCIQVIIHIFKAIPQLEDLFLLSVYLFWEGREVMEFGDTPSPMDYGVPSVPKIPYISPQ